MDDDGKSGSGLKISTESFTYEEVKLLRNALLLNFGLHFTIQKEWHIFYLSKSQLTVLAKFVERFMHFSTLVEDTKHALQDL